MNGSYTREMMSFMNNPLYYATLNPQEYALDLAVCGLTSVSETNS